MAIGFKGSSIILILFVLIIFAFGCQKENRAAGIAQTFDNFINTFIRNKEFSGSVLIAKEDRVLVNRGYGLANIESQTPNSPKTKFRIGSMTKQFTAALILLLAEEGSIHLEGKITDYLPNFRADTGNRITIYHLLTHTSGLPPGFSLPGLTPDHYHDLTVVEKFVVNHCGLGLDSEPGEQWAYSNLGFYILGAIIEKVSGKTFEENLSERIFIPLNMKDSGYDSENPPGGNFAAGYYPEEGSPISIGFADTYAAGAIYSTTEDLFKWDRALSSNELLSEKSRNIMFDPYKGYYGCGWFVTKFDGHLCQSHAGRIGGFATNIARYPEDRACIFILSNLGSTPLNHITRNSEAILFSRDYALPGKKASYRPSLEMLEKFTGLYDLRGLSLEIVLKEETLLVNMQGLPGIRTIPLSENEFEIPDMDAIVTFRRNSSHDFFDLILNMGSVNMLGEKAEQHR